MGRKRKHPELPYAGRPAIDPKKKVGTPLRALVTDQVYRVMHASADQHQINLSDEIRLAIHDHFQRLGLFEVYPSLRTDASWSSLIEAGLLAPPSDIPIQEESAEESE